MRIDAAAATDEAFILRSWLLSWRHAEVARRMPGDAYYDWQRRRIGRLLERGAVLVARPDDWPEGILGWLCGECVDGAVVHYVYVKRRERRSGVAGALVSELVGACGEPRAYTHRRYPMTSWLERRGFAYMPRLVRGNDEA